MFWLYRIFSLQSVSNLIRVIEIVGTLLIALRPWSPRLSFYRHHWCRHRVYAADGQFSFLDNRSLSVLTRIPLLGNAGQFLIKDLVLLGASIWTAAKARRVS